MLEILINVLLLSNDKQDLLIDMMSLASVNWHKS